MKIKRGLLWWVCALYALAVLVSSALTIYVVAMWRVALPSYDVVDHHAFLAAAAVGDLDWHGLWERHNGVHLIVLPKLVFWLDMYWLAGQGWLVTAVSVLAIIATLVMLLRRIYCVAAFDATEKTAFSLLALLIMSSVLLAESLVNPIDIQWSLLALGSVILASALDENSGWSVGRVAGLSLGFLLSCLSSAPVSLVLISAILVRFLVHPSQPASRVCGVPRLMVVLILLAIFSVGWEMLALQQGWPLLLLQLYKPLIAAQDLAGVEIYIRENPDMYMSWLRDAVIFMGRYVLVPLGHEWSVPLLVGVPFLVWLVSLWNSLRYWRAGTGFWMYLTIFPLLLGFAAGFSRFFTLYNYRHANMGFLLLLSSLLLVYSVSHRRSKSVLLAALLLCYVTLFMFVAVDEAGAWSQEGQNITRYLQIGNALGVKDPAKFAPVWKDDSANIDAVERSRAIFRQQRVGIYGSRGYSYYLGEIALPAVEVVCEHRLLGFTAHAQDARAFSLRAETHAVDGYAMTRALFSQGGVNVGWADAQLSSDKLWQQRFKSRQWGGHMVFEDVIPEAVTVIAYDDMRRCKPWVIPLPVKN